MNAHEPVTVSYATKDRTLALLIQAGNAYVSGEAMSVWLGVSRTAVNAAVRSLRGDGYVIDSVTNRGYRLLDTPDGLTAGELLAELGESRMERVVCISEIDSTTKHLMEIAEKNAPDGQVVLADKQTAGRGRVGKSFASPGGQGIYLSYLIRPQTSLGESAFVSDWLTVTGRTAVAVLEAIEEVCGITPQIKWVNDLFLNGRKICGILTQTDLEVESGAVRALIIGIGVNVHERTDDFPEELRTIATSIDQETGKRNSRPALAAAIIRRLDALRSELPGNADYYLAKYREHCMVLGKTIILRGTPDEEQALALRINDNFELVVRMPDGEEKALTGGEILRIL